MHLRSFTFISKYLMRLGSLYSVENGALYERRELPLVLLMRSPYLGGALPNKSAEWNAGVVWSPIAFTSPLATQNSSITCLTKHSRRYPLFWYSLDFPIGKILITYFDDHWHTYFYIYWNPHFIRNKVNLISLHILKVKFCEANLVGFIFGNNLWWRSRNHRVPYSEILQIFFRIYPA